MQFSRFVIRGVSAATVAMLGCAAQAAPTVFFGEDPYPDVALTQSPLARSNFLARLVAGVGSEGFESKSFGDVGPLALTFPGSAGNITATLNGDGQVENRLGVGTFNTTPGGSNWWETSNGSFDVTFSKPIAAFGFYGTDIGDGGGQVTLTLTDINDVSSVLSINSAGTQDGTQIFYGFVDTLKQYKSIVFGNTSAGGDLFGFDDMVIGDLGQLASPPGPSLPLPGTLALVSLSLLAVALVRRRT
jgi:hypothetical protein